MKIGESSALQLDDWCKAVLQSFEPAQRKQTLSKLAMLLRKQNQKRMTAQKSPDGKTWIKRAKPQNNNIRAKKKMMTNLRKAKHFKSVATPNLAYIGWLGFVGKVANEHHYGLKTDRNVQLPERQLLGATADDQTLIYDILLEMLPH